MDRIDISEHIKSNDTERVSEYEVQTSSGAHGRKSCF